jgi:hypothetical protein
MMTELVALLLTTLAPWRPDTAPRSSSPPLYDNLGSYHRAITTKSSMAQKYFDQGLRLTYGFNHPEAILAFQEASRLDPKCAMCQWGIAYALGPNINLPMDASAMAPAYAAVQKAVALSSTGTPAERALIAALSKRYAKSPPADRSSLDSAYAKAMAQVSARFPADQDAATLYAESLLDLSPWNQWTSEGQPRAGTREAMAALERVISINPMHPGACHYYIHTVEASATPELALPCANRLGSMMPGAGHLVHMPAHIYLLLGRYDDVIAANLHAVHSDETYIADRQPSGPYPLIYYSHNIHFLLVANLLIGNSAEAIAAANKLATTVPLEAVRAFPLAQYFVPLQETTLAKFGRWKELLATPSPPADLPYSVAIWRYTQGLAQAATGDYQAAQASLVAVKSTDLGDSEPGGPFGPMLLRMVASDLEGAIAARQGNWDPAIASLRQAVAIEDSLGYTEPPWSYYPLRHGLGAALLKAGRPAEAEAVYREDLWRHRHNGWALYGLAESLKQQGKAAAADSARAAFKTAWSKADVDLATLGF